jgi:hypothetical protein
MKRFMLLLGLSLSTLAPIASAAPFVLPQEMKACRIWQVPIPDAFLKKYMATETNSPGQQAPTLALLSENVNFNQLKNATTMIDSASMRIIHANIQRRHFSGQWRDQRLYFDADRQAVLESEALATLAAHLTTGTGSAQCIASGTESSLVGDQLRAYLEAEVQKTVKASVDAQMTAFLEALRKANEADRAALIERTLQELPKNASLLEALKNAMQAPATDAPSR